MRTICLESGGPRETERIGGRIGRLLAHQFNVALTGELGSGKTILAGGICRGLGVRDHITSPSFILVNEYEGRMPVYHVDLYRIESEEELASTGFDDLLSRDAVSIIEWAEKAKHRIPDPGLDILITYAGESERNLELAARGEEGRRILRQLEEAL